jgi:hypothetical protein
MREQNYIHGLASTHLNLNSTFPKQDVVKVQKVFDEVNSTDINYLV